jgi:cation diffusion facilitator CzcD-associated flavoprotein CzcO
MGEEHLDVLVVGAGLSGIGAACHLRTRVPHLRIALLEARDRLCGTWDLFRYPGVRSDSDMTTLGYSFAPWTAPVALADGPSILDYLQRTAHAFGVDRLVRYRHRVVAAEWSTPQARWRVHVEQQGDTGGPTRPVTLTCRFLLVCSGYYRYDAGWTPPIPGLADFAGPVVHPQAWPADLDVRGRRVVVIGSGATAVTLVPALATDAAHVTMLQRSPTYILPRPRQDALAQRLNERLGPRRAYPLVRWKNILGALALVQWSRRRPDDVRRMVRSAQQPLLPPGFDDDRHLTPRYDPWDERMCFVPDADLFEAICAGAASIVTGTIARVDPDAVVLTSGERLPADVLVTATGLRLLPIGGMTLAVDGMPVRVPDAVTYKGMMLSGVPNFALTVGYTDASWTLKADLVARYVCRLLEHLTRRGFACVVPLPPPADDPRAPLLGLSSGYVQRSLADLPHQGTRRPWRLHRTYLGDLVALRFGPLHDQGVRFLRRGEPLPSRAVGAAARDDVPSNLVRSAE